MTTSTAFSESKVSERRRWTQDSRCFIEFTTAEKVWTMNLHVLWTTCDDLTTGLKCYADRGCLSQKWTLPCSTCYKGECVIFTWKAKYWAISPRSRFFRYRRCKLWSHTLFREVIRNFQCEFSNDVSLGPKWWPIIRRDLWRFICGENVPGPLVYGEYLSETSLMQLNPGNPSMTAVKI